MLYKILLLIAFTPPGQIYEYGSAIFKQITSEIALMPFLSTIYLKKLFVTPLLLFMYGVAWPQYGLIIQGVDKDDHAILKALGAPQAFRDRAACASYIQNLPFTLQAKGYPAASVDSIHFDSTVAIIKLFLGDLYELVLLNTDAGDSRLLEKCGWEPGQFNNRPLNMTQLQELQWKVIGMLENEGYPFARLQMDSIVFEKQTMIARLKVDKGPLYRIDSIRIYGDARISNRFMQRYLDLKNGSIYNKEKLRQVSKMIRELPYLQEQQEWDMTLLGTGSVLNLYLKPKRSSQVNVLVGLLPDNRQTVNNKLLVTGEANIQLRNALGNGEMIGLNWQQLQVKSPRLNLAFQQPYLLGSAFGISTSFDLFKKDSSFLNLNFILGLQYSMSASRWGRVYLQHLQSNLLSVDTQQIKAAKKLPPEIDVSSVNLGIDYNINTTDYRLNPRSGSEWQFTISAGTRRVRRNSTILKLSDTTFSYASLYDTIKNNGYQFRVKINGAQYFRLGRQSTLKVALQSAWFQSPSIFRNELFQIGGYRLLRGFDEESIYTSRYAVATLEYRYLIGLNSFLFSFIDAGTSSNKSNPSDQTNRYLGAGVGMAFETKAGIFNISYAAGKRDDIPFNLRQSKIHLGYINYF